MEKHTLRGIGAGFFLLLAAAGCGGENVFTSPGFGNGDDEVTGAIRGQVTAGGAGVGGVRIIVVNYDSTTTDGQGLYEFAGVPAATYNVSLRVPANYTLGIGENSTREVRVAADGVAAANWTLQREGATAAAVPLANYASYTDP